MKSPTFETGFSDHNKLITTILRKTIRKVHSKEIVLQRLQEIWPKEIWNGTET